MNPVTLHIDGQDYVFRYIPAPSGFRYRLLKYPSVDDIYPFYMAETVIRGENQRPQSINDEEDGMSWYDGIALCARLTGFQNNPLAKSNSPSDRIFESYQEYVNAVKSNRLFIRIPTEFEWEWAALGGEDFQYAGCTNVDEVAWYGDNCEIAPRVRKKKPNGYGLYDMSGNVWEWTANWSGYAQYKLNDLGPHRVLRGGSWSYEAAYARVAGHRWYGPGGRDDFLGVRLCFSANPTTLDLIRHKGLMR